MDKKIRIVVAHYGLDRKISREECEAALEKGDWTDIFVDFEVGLARLDELYNLPFDNLALLQTRKFAQLITPLLKKHPDAHIAYFGLSPISLAFHFGYLLGNTHSYSIYQWHHRLNQWYFNTTAPDPEYKFSVKPLSLPREKQKGKGTVVIRVATSFTIDRQTTYEVISNPANEFDIELETTNTDSLFNQQCIGEVVESFQQVLDTYANNLTDRDQIHLFISSSAGLPFALGTRINSNIYPYLQTYQYDRSQTPKNKEAVLVTKETNDRQLLTDEERGLAAQIRNQWSDQLSQRLNPFINTVVGKKNENWIHSICQSDKEYDELKDIIKHPWQSIIDIGSTSLQHDKIDQNVVNIEDGFEYIEKTNTWLVDDGFLAGLQKRLSKIPEADILQAGRLFFFHEALHYSPNGHRLTREVANGIGQFPKVIEEADYQADVWGLLTEYRYCCMYEPEKLKGGIKNFFCNAIDIAVETMWSFVDTGTELESIQIRSMNRFLNWYWQYIRIEDLTGEGSLHQVIAILLDRPVIEFAGAPIQLRAHRTFFKLNSSNRSRYQLAAFINNKVRRFSPATIDDVVDGFSQLNGSKIKSGLKSFQVSIE